MAAKTPTTIKRENLGSLNLVIAHFDGTVASNDLDDGDTWASGLTGIVAFWTGHQDNPTTQASVGIAVTESSGTFTFYPAEDDALGKLFVLVRS